MIVFHEKEGRRHAHAVWCRIDTENMKAVQLSYCKNKMAELSKELYLEHGWQLPKGHLDRAKRNPLNFSLYEWQQAKRLDVDPRVMKQAPQKCWRISNDKQAFERALTQHGYSLAKGDRRGYVAVDWQGEVISLSRWLNVKPKTLKARLGEREDLPDVDEVKAKIDKTLVNQVAAFNNQIKQFYQRRFKPLNLAKQKMNERHKRQRDELNKQQQQQQRKEQEQSIRSARHAAGWRGLWHRVTGKYAEIEKKNEREAYMTYQRDQKERDEQIFNQMSERQNLQVRLDNLNQDKHKALQDVRLAVFSKLPNDKIKAIENNVLPPYFHRNNDLKLDM